MKQRFLLFTGIGIYCYAMSVMSSGCAQIGMPTGGTKDTLAPLLERASPAEKNTNFKGNRITLNFDEYVEIQETQKNVLVSPLPKNNPDIRSNLKTISVRIKDTLQPNTTYSINFGDAIKDVNEGNIFKNFTYVFSTGSVIDSMKFSGKVFMAETGKADSTMIVLLYKNATDSSVTKTKPNYIAKVKSDGTFDFNYLPGGTFKVYALTDGDGNKYYNSKTETFAFAEGNKDIIISDTTAPITLYASALEKPKPVSTAAPTKNTATIKAKGEKKLTVSSTLVQGKQDLTTPLQLNFSNPVATVNEQKIFFTDTNYRRLPSAKISFDSTRKSIIFDEKWVPETDYRLVIDTSAVIDSLGNQLAKNDTLKFSSKKTEDYGKVLLRFTNLDLAKHPVLQIFEADNIKFSYSLTGTEWSNALFPPGEYSLRILYDDNRNGKWDPGNYSIKLQPEKVIALPAKLSVRANWDNEREIKL